jgi:hypothetical protein
MEDYLGNPSRPFWKKGTLSPWSSKGPGAGSLLKGEKPVSPPLKKGDKGGFSDGLFHKEEKCLFGSREMSKK